MRRYYNIRVRSDAPGEFQTGEMCELNIEGVIFVQFIGMKRLDYQLSLRECPILCVRGFGLQVVRESVGVSHG